MPRNRHRRSSSSTRYSARSCAATTPTTGSRAIVALSRFREEVRRVWRKWLVRRNNIRSCTGELMRTAPRYPLSRPAVAVHSVCSEAVFEEPDAVSPARPDLWEPRVSNHPGPPGPPASPTDRVDAVPRFSDPFWEKSASNRATCRGAMDRGGWADPLPPRRWSSRSARPWRLRSGQRG